MFTILLIVLIIAALGGFGHTGYRRGWYGDGYYERPAGGGAWGGGGLGLVLLLVELFLLFSHPHYRY
jgi:hypothetical protein